ncbi:YceI family protein [Flavobacterium sp. SUN052]|uniref:YceI family protein n=1 Tax=Flavobacterium sp. SUN052 TaxID=3002441 RepID=UPI00237ED2E0|nr:YceI family protein [Flavobacterium sp. SUN052]MEC4003909.1 YceI family protein [Flavobacterium sp. SUN052]
MKKIILVSVILLNSISIFSQKMITRSGEVKFEASMPAVEEVAAKTNTASCIFDKTTGDFAALILIKSFKFKVPLMEEHFNENYIESDKFPKATFKGKVLNYDAAKVAAGKATFDIEGDLTIHGITKKVKTKITFSQLGDKLTSTCNFNVKPSDYDIKIPSLVKSKIAESVAINCKFDLENKQ